MIDTWDHYNFSFYLTYYLEISYDKRLKLMLKKKSNLLKGKI